MKNIYLIIVVALISCFVGYYFGIGNQYSKYGDTGLPKNCRALISENLKDFANQEYTAKEALYSINRNCGPNGYIWNER